jgi:hypothetical protein
MGRTLPSAAQVFQIAEQELAGFRGGLSRTDQRVLDGLFDAAHRHVAEAAYAAHPLPMEIFLLSMLLEQHKELLRLKTHLEQILGEPLDPRPKDPGRLF